MKLESIQSPSHSLSSNSEDTSAKSEDSIPENLPLEFVNSIVDGDKEKSDIYQEELEVTNENENQKLQKQGKKWPWSCTSEELLQQSEENILTYLSTPYNSRFVNIGNVVGDKESKIWTISFNENSNKIPLVLLHGMGAGVALWVLNLDELAKDRPVYAIDLLGFGRSSRPHFSTDPTEVENQMASFIEAWRVEMKLEKFVLLGHSLGGYLSTAYTLRYPEAVQHLVLADPWGFKDKPKDLSEIGRIPLPVRLLARLFEPLNPLWAFRLVGPKLIQKFRPDLIRKFENFLDEPEIKISHYMYHCNAQNPTGEAAFHTLMSQFGWAKNPMSHRLPLLHESIPVTFLYGSNSWVDHCPPDKIKELRGTEETCCDVQILEGAGHHVYADTKEVFNEIVLSVCSNLDS